MVLINGTSPKGYLAWGPIRKSKDEIRNLLVDSRVRFNSVYSFSRGDSTFDSKSSGEAALIRVDIWPIEGVCFERGRMNNMPIEMTKTARAAAREGIKAGLRTDRQSGRVLCPGSGVRSSLSGIEAIILLIKLLSKSWRMDCLSLVNFGLRDVQSSAYSRQESHLVMCFCTLPEVGFPESMAWDIFHLYMEQNILLLLIIRMKIYGQQRWFLPVFQM